MINDFMEKAAMEKAAAKLDYDATDDEIKNKIKRIHAPISLYSAPSITGGAMLGAMAADSLGGSKAKLAGGVAAGAALGALVSRHAARANQAQENALLNEAGNDPKKRELVVDYLNSWTSPIAQINFTKKYNTLPSYPGAKLKLKAMDME